MIVDPDMPDHWKVQMLSGLLDHDPVAPVYLLRLWGHCQNRKTDTFNNLPPLAVRAICKYVGDADRFDQALRECGFIHRDEKTGCVVVTGWSEKNASLCVAWENGKKGGRPKGKTKTSSSGNKNPRGNHVGNQSVIPLDNPEETHGLSESDDLDNLSDNPGLNLDNPGKTDGSPEKRREEKRREEERGNKPKDGQLTRPDFISQDLWDDYKKFRTRKKAPLTVRAWSRIEKEILEGINRGYCPEDMLEEAITSGWQAFKLEWYEKRNGLGDHQASNPKKAPIGTGHQSGQIIGKSGDSITLPKAMEWAS